jgi:hypothetical protein
MSDKQAYEVEGLRESGGVYTVELLGHQSEGDAMRLVQHYADLLQQASRSSRRIARQRAVTRRGLLGSGPIKIPLGANL